MVSGREEISHNWGRFWRKSGLGFDMEIKVCILIIESLDVFPEAGVFVRGQSLAPNPVFKLLVGLAGV